MVWRGRAATPAVALRPGNVGLGPGAAASCTGRGPEQARATQLRHPGRARKRPRSDGTRVGHVASESALPPVTAPHPRAGHAMVAAPARPDRRARALSRRTRVRLRAAVGLPRLSRSRHSRGPVASRAGSQRSRSRRAPVGLVTVADPAHPSPSPKRCGRRGHQGGPRAGMADSETKDDQTQVTQRR